MRELENCDLDLLQVACSSWPKYLFDMLQKKILLAWTKLRDNMQIIPKESTKTNLTDCSVFAAPLTLPNDEKLVLERASVDTVSTLNFPLFPPEKKYFLSLIIVMFSL